MRFQITSHAVDRYIERSGESLTYKQAAARLEAGLEGATRCGKTDKGQPVFAMPGTPPMYAVVKMGPDRRDPTSKGAVVVTVLSEKQWMSGSEGFDEASEILAAYEDLTSRAPNWTPAKPINISKEHARSLEMARSAEALSLPDSNNVPRTTLNGWLAKWREEDLDPEHERANREAARADDAERRLAEAMASLESISGVLAVLGVKPS